MGHSVYPEFESAPGDKPLAYVLVGLPASGKSSWACNHPGCLPVASSDKYIEAYAARHNVPYAEAFRAHATESFAKIRDEIALYRAQGLPFIWDQVNIEPAERRAIHKILEPTHRVVYVCFLTPLEECLRRHAARPREGGQVIDEARIRELAARTRWPVPGREPFFRVMHVVHPLWKGKRP